MSTFGEMNRRIADELKRGDLSSQINLAIKSAITYYNADNQSFREHRAQLNTDPSTEYYGLPSNFIEIDDLRISVNNSIYQLTRKSQNYINAIYSAEAIDSGTPDKYSVYQEQIRLYPVPDQTYTLYLDYKRSLTDLSATSDTNDFMTKYENLIRSRAKWDIYQNVLKIYDDAQVMKQQELDEERAMIKREAKYHAGNGIRGYL